MGQVECIDSVGTGEESIAELRRIARIDGQNPLVHLRLAQELRKLDRLEESLESYKKAVELVPDLLAWRLTLARARFDVLDYEGADRDVQYVLQKPPPVLRWNSLPRICSHK